MYQPRSPYSGYPATPLGHIQNPKHTSPPGTSSLHSSPLTPPITSPNSAYSLGSPFKEGNAMGWLPNFGRTSSHDKPRTASPPNNPRSTGWGAPQQAPAITDGRIYSHDMASQYFTLAHQEGAGREGQGKRTGGMGFMQRIMHRTNSCYPLPCDDQEQQRLDYQHHTLRLFLGSLTYGVTVQAGYCGAAGYAAPRRILDIGTGTGIWAMDMADQHPDFQVTGIDIVPIQSRKVPPNCSFEVYDANCGLPYPDQSFDVCHLRFARLGIRNLAYLLAEVARVLKRGGTILILDSTFPLHITLADLSEGALPSHCPGLKAFQDAIKWSLAQGGKANGERGDHPLMDSGQVSSLVAYTPGFVGTSVREIQMPLGDWKTDAHTRTVGQMSMHNTQAMVTALKPVIMKQGCYTSREFEDFRSGLIKDLSGPYRLQTNYYLVTATKA